MLAWELIGDSGRNPAWIATDLTLALATQAALGGAIYAFLRRPGWRRGLGLGLTAIALVPTILWLYVIAIPTRHLVEPELRSELATWPSECSIPSSALAQILKSPVTLELEKAREAWITVENLRYAVLRMPGCRVEVADEALRGANSAGVTDTYLDFVIAGGRALYSTGPANLLRDRWLIRAPGQQPVQLQNPPGHGPSSLAPILSNDGARAAWGIHEKRSDGTAWSGAAIRNWDGSGETRISITDSVHERPEELLELGAQELIVRLADGTIVGLGMDGHVLWGPVPIATGASFRRIGDGWVAWHNDYIGNERSGVEWSVAAGRGGSHSVPAGRRIDAAAADPERRFIAVSVSGSLHIGDVQDAVYVLRTSDGSEAFRQFFPRYSRPVVAFLGTEYLAYSASGTTHVLRVPK